MKRGCEVTEIGEGKDAERGMTNDEMVVGVSRRERGYEKTEKNNCCLCKQIKRRA